MPDFSKRIFYAVPGMSETVVLERVYREEGADRLAMRVCLPRDLRADTRLPAVFFIHGGPIPVAFAPPTQWGIFQSYGELMAASGFVGIVFNHRLFAQGDYPRSQSDIQAAMHYVRQHAADLHVDENRIAVWIFSGGGPNLSWMLREPPAGLRCAITYYAIHDARPFLPPTADATMRAAAEGMSPAAHIKAHGENLPLLIARAGLDSPQINLGTDRFVAEALAANRQVDLLNHPSGRHGFDYLDDNSRTQRIIERTMDFLRAHLKSNEE